MTVSVEETMKILGHLSDQEREEWLKLFEAARAKQREALRASQRKRREMNRKDKNPWTYMEGTATRCHSCRNLIRSVPRQNSGTLGRGCREPKHWDYWARRAAGKKGYQADSPMRPRPKGSTLVDLFISLGRPSSDDPEWNRFLRILGKNEGNIRKSVSEWRSSE